MVYHFNLLELLYNSLKFNEIWYNQSKMSKTEIIVDLSLKYAFVLMQWHGILHEVNVASEIGEYIIWHFRSLIRSTYVDALENCE